MGKKNKKPDAPGEEIVEEVAAAEETIEETPAEEVAAPEAPAAEPEAPAGEPAPAEEAAPAEAPVPEPVAESEGKIGTVNRPVNFRTGPTFKNAAIAELKAGSKIVLSGTVEGDKGAWYKCEFDGRTGYVKATGISVSD